MSKFYLKNVKRTMFVVIDNQLFLSLPNLHISHGDWFKKEGWADDADDNDKIFMENNPRGYVSAKGVYIYQGYNARVPAISKKLLKKIIKNLYLKLNINSNSHIFLGTIDTPNKNDKLSPKHDLGSISSILKIKDSFS